MISWYSCNILQNEFDSNETWVKIRIQIPVQIVGVGCKDRASWPACGIENVLIIAMIRENERWYEKGL